MQLGSAGVEELCIAVLWPPLSYYALCSYSIPQRTEVKEHHGCESHGRAPSYLVTLCFVQVGRQERGTHIHPVECDHPSFCKKVQCVVQQRQPKAIELFQVSSFAYLQRLLFLAAIDLAVVMVQCLSCRNVLEHSMPCSAQSMGRNYKERPKAIREQVTVGHIGVLGSGR